MSLNPIDAIRSALSRIGGNGGNQVVSPLPQASPTDENSWVNQQLASPHPAGDRNYYTQLYQKAVNSPGGINYKPPQQNILQQALGHLLPQAPKQAQASEMDLNQPVPSGMDVGMNYIRQQAGGQDPTAYYKAFSDPSFMAQIQAADKAKPGLGNLLLMMAFHESTLGNSGNGNNLFGVLPGGEGSGRQASFQTPGDAVNYEVGENVLGGGANKNMDVMHDQNPLTLGRVKQLYNSYNPEGDYINTVLQVLANQKKN